MKTRFHPMNKSMNILENKENIDPLFPNEPVMKKNAKENFFDEMDQLLNADFWQKNVNRTNLIPSKKDAIPKKNILMTNNDINNNVYNNPFGLKNNQSNKMDNDFTSLMNMMNKEIDKMPKSLNIFNIPKKGVNANNNIFNNSFFPGINQTKQENKLSNISLNKNNITNFPKNKNGELYKHFKS